MYGIYQLIYFLSYGSVGSYSPYIPVLFSSYGIPSSILGLAFACGTLCTTLISPLLCVIADTYTLHSTLARLSILASILSRLLIIPAAKSTHSLNVILSTSLNSICNSTFSPLFDAKVVSMLPNSSDYGKFRLWGAIGFGCCVFISGFLIDLYSNSSNLHESTLASRFIHSKFDIAIYLGLLLLISVLPFCFCIDFTPNKSISHPDPVNSDSNHTFELIESHEQGDSDLEDNDNIVLENTSTQRRSEFHSFWQWMTDIHVVVFFLILLISGLGNGMIETFLFVRLNELGATSRVLGISRLLMCLGELPFFHYNEQLVSRFGVFGVLGIVQCAYCVRFFWYSVLQNPWNVVYVEVLHGITYGALWGTSSVFAHQIAPAGLEATAQSLVGLIHWGIGFTLGSTLGGVLYEHVGAVNTFRCGLIITTFTFITTCVFKLIYSERSHSRR
uniref:Major facilitator superfamily associated domain-containing protein n=1 Tax=Timspurckia oligopyrenoides TaxID=708627 RepID=A0A7S0ZL95_9RHOD|mmetsp:Transcript_9594/g.17288  ORF Transcript_9594/g.17288 Transcript_9594/m.17288 type:complete len:445 (+) Transcript_9594:98-1432(+)